MNRILHLFALTSASLAGCAVSDTDPELSSDEQATLRRNEVRTRIGVGDFNTCAIGSDSTMKCWGYNVGRSLLGAITRVRRGRTAR